MSCMNFFSSYSLLRTYFYIKQRYFPVALINMFLSKHMGALLLMASSIASVSRGDKNMELGLNLVGQLCVVPLFRVVAI